MSVLSRKRKPVKQAESAKPRIQKLHDPQPEPDRTYIYTRQQAAATMGCSELTLIRAMDAGYLAGYRIGNRIRHSGAQLIAWRDAGGRTGHISKKKGYKQSPEKRKEEKVRGSFAEALAATRVGELPKAA